MKFFGPYFFFFLEINVLSELENVWLVVVYLFVCVSCSLGGFYFPF